MKTKLFIAATLFVASSAVAQFNESNEPNTGTSSTMYVIDESAPSLSATTGNGVEWDYSTYGNLNNQTRTIEMIDPSASTYSSLYSSSTKAMQIEDGTLNYFNSSATSRVSQGYVFSEPNFGDVRLVLDTDEATVMTYPMNVGDEFTDAYSGTLHYSYSGFPQSTNATGTFTGKYDGKGTLKLANGVEKTDISRYVSIDTANVTAPVLGELELIRVSYEYYDLGNTELPLFVHSFISIKQPSGNVITEITLILSSENPTGSASLQENELDVAVYPNPVSEKLTLKAEGNNAYSLTDLTGATVASGNFNNQLSVNVSEFKTGVYILRLENAYGIVNKRVIVK